MKASTWISLLAVAMFNLTAAEDDPIRIGIIGLDTSHVIAFTDLINKTDWGDQGRGGKVVAAFKGGSPDVESSASRVDGYTERLQKEWGIEIVPTIEELCKKVDAILLESVDGRPHLEQARPVIEAGLPMFIDKPLAGSLADAIAIATLAERKQVPWFSSSSYRYYDSMRELKEKDVGEVRGAISYGPCSLEPHHPDLFWYGVHPTEALYTIMGEGCETVTRVTTADTDVVTGIWGNGAVGTLRGLRNQKTPHNVIVFGTKAVVQQGEGGGSYAPLVKEIMKFFQTKEVPIPPGETLELFAFMEAADESKRQGGRPVKISDVMERAKREAMKKIE